jgi:hypothetical protein
MESLLNAVSDANATIVNRFAVRALGHDHCLVSKGAHEWDGGGFAHR